MKRRDVIPQRGRRALQAQRQPGDLPRAGLDALRDFHRSIFTACTGFCICGALVARHFDRQNRFRSCEEAR